jgi:hypothetical protein
MGTGAVGLRSLGALVVGVRVQGTMSPLNRVMVHLGGARLWLVGADAIGLLGAGAARVGCEGASVDCIGWVAVGLLGAALADLV